MTSRLENKAIIVIGSGSGIGAATVRRLAAEGARVCAADINEAGAKAVAEEVVAAGGEAFAVHIDLADEASVNAAVAAAVARLGGLDGAHVNAADLQTIMRDSDALSVDLAVFDRTLAINLRGHLLCTRAVLPQLLARGGGAIVYTSSGSADSGEPVRPSYGASKSGLNAFMRHVASRWGRRASRRTAWRPVSPLRRKCRKAGSSRRNCWMACGRAYPARASAAPRISRASWRCSCPRTAAGSTGRSTT